MNFRGYIRIINLKTTYFVAFIAQALRLKAFSVFFYLLAKVFGFPCHFLMRLGLLTFKERKSYILFDLYISFITKNLAG